MTIDDDPLPSRIRKGIRQESTRTRRERKGSSMGLINISNDLFDPISEHSRFYCTASTANPEVFRNLRQRPVTTPLHQIHRYLARLVLLPLRPTKIASRVSPYCRITSFRIRFAPACTARHSYRAWSQATAHGRPGCSTNSSPPSVGTCRSAA